MSIKRRIWALPLISTIIFGIGLAVIVYFVAEASSSIASTEQLDYPLLDDVKTLTSDVRSVVTNLKDAINDEDKRRVDVVGEQATKVRNRIKQLASKPAQSAMADRLGKEFEDYFVPALGVTRSILGIDKEDPKIAIDPKALPVLEADLAKCNSFAQQQFKAGIANSNERVHNILTTSILVALLVILSLVIVSYYVVRNIWQQLGGEPEYACEIAQAVAAGDLTKTISVATVGNDSVLAALREMQGKLAGIVSSIKVSSETILVGCGEIASGNADLSSRTEQQASSLEETASSMEELTSTVRQNADNARQANQLAITASDVAQKGGAVVQQVVQTMGSINDSARKIVDIIGVIDGIAFQTNILALNAAVEAARAGEQGRGFAVVASEVRNLAQRSAGAAKEIKSLIGDSVDKVNTGAKLVDQAGATMGEIVASVKQVSDIIGEITVASQEQTSGIEQINQAISQMDAVTQQNAALVEQAAAAAESLQDQASNLGHVVGVFKLNGRDAAVIVTAAGNSSRPVLGARHPIAVATVASTAITPAISRAGPPTRNGKPSKQAADASASTGSEWEEF